MSNKVKLRDSNMELLRIISMLMILNLHSFTSNDSLIGKSAFTLFDYTREALCIGAVDIYILISGYYQIRWKTKNFCSLIFQIYFWVFFIYVVGGCFGYFSMSLSTIWARCNCLSNAYWFVTAYLALYLFSPPLNEFAKSASTKKLLYFLLFYFLFQFYLCINANVTFGKGYGVLSFIGIYLLGALIRQAKDEILKVPVTYQILGLCVTTFLMVFMMWYLTVKMGWSMQKVKSSFWGLAYNSPLVIFQSCIIFLLFLRMRLKSKFVNWVSASVFAVYLLHMHPDIKRQFIHFTHNDLYMLPPVLHNTYILIGSITIFAVAILVDKVRIACFDYLYSRLYFTTQDDGRKKEF